MNDSVAGKVNPQKLAKEGQSLEGLAPISAMERLAKLLVAKDGEISYKMRFDYDQDGRCFIQGEFSGMLNLECNRCLKGLVQKIAEKFKISPIASTEDVKRLPEEYEGVLMDDGLIDVLRVIEDEMILALPLISKHSDDDKSCLHNFDEQSHSAEQVSESPFKVLKNL